MRKMFFSYSNLNKEIVTTFRNELAGFGQLINTDLDAYAGYPIMQFIRQIKESLNDASIIISFITREYLDSKFCREEFSLIQSYVKESNDKLFIPILFDLKFSEVTDLLIEFQAMMVSSKDIKLAIQKTTMEIFNWETERELNQIKREEELKRIEVNSEEYIEDALKTLRSRELTNRRNATFCYIIGYITLAGGVGFGIFNFEAGENLLSNLTWYQCIYLLTKGLILIGFLVACSKYVFNLGKAYMNESLKNADRMHAISFGKFYLKGYGDKATWNELKEVFQHWNLDKNSFFTNLDSNEFDPKIKEIISEINKIISIKK